MIKPICTLALAACGALLPLTTAAGATEESEGILRDGFVTNLDLLIGAKLMDGDWDVDDADTTLLGAGLNYSVRGLNWPVGIQIAYTYAENQREDEEAEIESRDLQIGLFVPFGTGTDLRWEAGGGFSQAWVDVRGRGTPAGEIRKNETRAGGIYARGALRWSPTYWFDVSASASYHYNPADTTFDKDLNAGGILVFGGAGLRF
jgi:hypothetical protein